MCQANVPNNVWIKYFLYTENTAEMESVQRGRRLKKKQGQVIIFYMK